MASAVGLPDGSVSLMLNKEEAEILDEITRRIGGHPIDTYRGITDQIGSVLEEAGVEDNGRYYYFKEGSGGLTAAKRIK